MAQTGMPMDRCDVEITCCVDGRARRAFLSDCYGYVINSSTKDSKVQSDELIYISFVFCAPTRLGSGPKHTSAAKASISVVK